MKRIDKQAVPNFLQEFADRHPYVVGKHREIWDELRNQGSYQAEIVDRLLDDQGHLCAYCENSIFRRNGAGGIQDIAIEHFHPKSSTQDNHPWALDWNNLFAVCLGGSNIHVHDPDDRFGVEDDEGVRRKELTCDKAKGEEILDGKILNPLSIPNSPSLFKVKRSSGMLEADENNCLALGVSKDEVTASIESLNLNARRLCRARSKTLDEISKMLVKLQERYGLAEAAEKIAIIRFRKTDGKLFPFFTACRSYLGNSAEKIISK
ncbi:retron system putative HNH endonuclease [uncultured Cohaesibacter sp.]|uniref:retron system putative HNH endonuclease n=1 Tax=uncultured Cohaesibacter sp. TaxID=1002546 RepID=UPI0029C65A0E|nr:retron system putative HNH endonuclease [uncultured Cohaesibacter sp.]